MFQRKHNTSFNCIYPSVDNNIQNAFLKNLIQILIKKAISNKNNLFGFQIKNNDGFDEGNIQNRRIL